MGAKAPRFSAEILLLGANDQEADTAGSRRDFVAKYTIVKKETKETKYWLAFLMDA
ncbi:four helix bundle protein, partial [Candidatus Gottesmanbacteria bacterium]|nr:four helix bundle protein [Candidatus Gottesmanbacteria bacterium]